LAALLAGLVNIGRRPPLLALSEGASADELVRLRAILDTATPVIERRSAALAGAAEQTRRFELAAMRESEALAERRAELVRRQQRFSEVERQFAARAASLEGEAVIAGDQVLASGERIGSAQAEAESLRIGLATARLLAADPLAPARPMAGDAPLPTPDFGYRLPVDGSIRDGLGSVSKAGVRSRGIFVAADRGAVVSSPAAGRILFAAPYRGQDGVVIIDHGRGWTSLLLGVSSSLPKGTMVEPGEPIGRALGPVGVELRRNGTAVSPAFIAASSELLSNASKSR
jgi:septal ring factor EnvC (AmiA/AmiB activator)